MNIFETALQKEFAPVVTLGNPLNDDVAIYRRTAYFSHLTKGNGFRSFPKEPRKNADGLTRGDRKRLAFQRAFHPETMVQ